MHNLNTITVNRKLFSKTRTLKSAINQAQPGDKIVLEPGKYKEFVIINKPVTIVGQGNHKEVIIQGAIKTTADLTIENITFDGNFTNAYEFGLYINGGKSIVTDCHFTQMNFYGIYVDNEASADIKNVTFTKVCKGIEASKGASILVEDSKFLMNQSNGVIVTKNAKGMIQRCEFQQIEYPSIYLSESSETIVQDCVIHSGHFRGIDAEYSKAIFINCEIYRNKGTQLFITNNSDIKIKNCTIHSAQDEGSGIFVIESTVEIENSKLSNHQSPQICADKSTLTLKESKIFNAGSNGIRLLEGSQATIENCEIYNHKYIQISVENGSFLSIHNSAVYDGEESGIQFENAQGLVEHCKIYRNLSGQLSINDGSEVTVNDTHIFEPKPESFGCYVINSSKLIMNHCEIEEHKEAQIYVEQSKIEIHSSKIHGGTGLGICLMFESEGVIQDCDIYQHGELPQIGLKEFCNILLQQSRIYSSGAQGIYFENSKGVIKDCTFYENNWRQIDVTEESKVEILDTKIYRGQDETNGLVVTDASTAEIMNCIFSDHDFPQIVVNEKSKFLLRDSQIVDGRDTMGIRIVEATGLIEKCEFRNNGEYPQIVIEEKSLVTINSSQVHSGKGIGIVINNAEGIMKDCDIYNNILTQLQIEADANAEVTRCRIYDGPTHGIRVSTGARANIQDVSVYGHYGEYAQVVIKEGANPVFQRCRIFNGSHDGIFIFERALGIIEDCYIYNNVNNNFCIVKGSEPILRRNRILNGNVGVYLDNANPIIENCIFEDHLYDDLYMDGNSKPVLFQNEFNSVKEQEKSGTDATNNSKQSSPSEKYEEILGFNPYEIEVEELKVRLIQVKKKWISRMNAPSMEKRQEAERVLKLIEDLEKELLSD